MLQTTIDGNIITAVLSFTNIRVDDAGEYSCIAIFQDFSASVNTITVMVDPGIVFELLLYYTHIHFNDLLFSWLVNKQDMAFTKFSYITICFGESLY